VKRKDRDRSPSGVVAESDARGVPSRPERRSIRGKIRGMGYLGEKLLKGEKKLSGRVVGEMFQKAAEDRTGADGVKKMQRSLISSFEKKSDPDSGGKYPVQLY